MLERRSEDSRRGIVKIYCAENMGEIEKAQSILLEVQNGKVSTVG